MNLSKLSFISILAATAVATAFAATTGGLRHQPIETLGEEFVIALSDAADEDTAAHHAVDASDVVIDAGQGWAWACSPRGGSCNPKKSCCAGE